MIEDNQSTNYTHPDPNSGLVEFLQPYYDKYKNIFDAVANRHVIASLATGFSVPIIYSIYNAYKLLKNFDKSKKVPFDETLEKIYSDIGIAKDTPTFTTYDGLFPWFYSPRDEEGILKIVPRINLEGDTNLKDRKFLDQLKARKLSKELVDRILEKGMILVPPSLSTHGILAREASHGWVEKSNEAPISRFIRRYLYSGIAPPLGQITLSLLGLYLGTKAREMGPLSMLGISALPIIPALGNIITDFVTTRRAIKKHIEKSDLSDEEKSRQKKILKNLFRETVALSLVPSFVVLMHALGHKFKAVVDEMNKRNFYSRIVQSALEELNQK